MLLLTSENWTLHCRDVAERDALLTQAEDYEVPVCGSPTSRLPEALSIGWCGYTQELVAYEQTAPDGLPSPGVRGFQAMCARYAAFNVLA